MQVLFETAYLAPGQAQSAADIELDGEQIVEEADFFRQATVTLFPRANTKKTLSFTTHWVFATTVAAEVFMLGYIDTLPMGIADSGPLQCKCGAENPATAAIVYASNAVLRNVRMKQVGVSVDVRYTFEVAGFSSSVPPNLPGFPNQNEQADLVFRRGSIALSIGAVSLAVSYSSPLPGSPGMDPQVWISGPSGASIPIATTDHDTVNTTGFNCEFSGSIPGNGYFLNYFVAM